jgi:hypothetical protein
LTVANAGPSNATSVALSEPMPSGLLVLPDGVVAPADGVCTIAVDRTAVTCTFATIPPGQSRIVTVATNVYSVADDKLVWASQSETFNPASLRETVDEVLRVTSRATGEVLKARG